MNVGVITEQMLALVDPLTVFWSTLGGTMALLVIGYFWFKALFRKRIEADVLPSEAMGMFHRQLVIAVCVLVLLDAIVWFAKDWAAGLLSGPVN